MKRIISLCLTALMILGISLNLSAAETGNYSITLNGAKEGHVYEAYHIFEGNLNSDESILTDIDWGKGIDGVTFLGELIQIEGYETCTDARSVAEVLAGFSDNSEELDRFADLAQKHLTQAAGTSVYDETAKTYKIEGLLSGYYFVKDTAAIASYDAATKYILEVVKDITVEVKSDVPSLEKYIVEGEDYKKANTAAIGDQVEYALISRVPEMDGYDTYKFVIHDTFSEGLTFNEDVEVLIGTDKLDGEAYLVTKNEQSVTIEILDFITYKNKANEQITITYSAALNKKAVIGSAGNSNMAYLEFSNDPNGEMTGETPDSYTMTFLAGIRIFKVDDSESPEALTGARFEITGTKINHVKILKDGLETWYEKNEDVNASAQVGADGILSFEGLSEGEYVIREIKAPDGYNLLTDTIRIKLTCTLPAEVKDGEECADWAYETDGAIKTTGEAKDGIIPLRVVNKKGLILPSTGGIGTKGFYVTGFALFMAAAVFMLKKHGMEK